VCRHRFADYGRQVVNLEPRLIHSHKKAQKAQKAQMRLSICAFFAFLWLNLRMNQPRLEIDHLAAVIRESMAAHQGESEPIRVAPAVSTENSFPQIKLQPDFQPHSDHRYHVNDLLRYHDRAFVNAAYRGVLKRSPSETELLRDLKQLRSGNVNKIDLLATLRFTPVVRAI
jgi:hypothetical protein